MALFDVSIEDMAFADRRPRKKSLTQRELAQLNRQAKAENLFPQGVQEIVDGYVSEDDGQGKSDIKFFVGITLRVEASDWEDAEDIEPPKALLDKAADILAPTLARENSWEVLDSNPA